MYIYIYIYVVLRNSPLRKHAPEQMSWLAAERAMFCTTKKFVKTVSTRITSKCCEDGIAQPIKVNGKSSAYFLSLFLCWCDTSSWRVVRCRTFRHGRPKNCRSRCCTLHAWRSVLIIQCTQTFLYNTLPRNFGVRFFEEIHHPGACFQLLASAWRFEMIENGSRLARKWCIRAGIELNTTIGQLVKTRWPIGYCVCDGRGVYVDIIGLKTMQWELHMYAYVRTQKIALDIAEIPTWVI